MKKILPEIQSGRLPRVDRGKQVRRKELRHPACKQKRNYQVEKVGAEPAWHDVVAAESSGKKTPEAEPAEKKKAVNA